MLAHLEYGPPIIAFIAMSMILWVATEAEGIKFFSAIQWYRWDSNLYAQIAQRGYYVARCSPLVGSVHVNEWCGNAAWFPGYSAIVAIFYDLGLPLVGMTVAVSWFFDLLVLIVAWNAFLRAAPTTQGYFGLAFVACCPGGIYMRAAFPMSTAIFFMLLWLIALRDRRWIWAGITGGCAAFTYTTALLVVPLTVVWILWAERPVLRRRIGMAAVSGVLCGLGTLAAIGLIALDTHRLNGFFLNQSTYKHGLHEPFANLWPIMKIAFHNPGGQVGNLEAVVGAEALMVAGIVIVLLVGVIALTLRGRATAWDWFLIFAAVLIWLFPATQADVSYYRDDTLLVVPVVALLVRMRSEWVVLIAAASLSVFPFMAYFFFTNLLI